MHLYQKPPLAFLGCNMDFNFKSLQVERHNKFILIVTLSRPDVKNAMNGDMIADFNTLWTELTNETSELRCVIITGENDAFCAGADLKERKKMTVDMWKAQVSQLRKSILDMMQCPIPVICAVNGPAFGGGLELILASDFAYAATIATFAQSEVKLGIIPGALGTQNLPKACGIKRAKELIFSAKVFSAEEAYHWGIINKICEPEHLMSDVLNIANKICDNAPIAVREAKKSINSQLKNIMDMGFSTEFDCYQRTLNTKDRKEGIVAFIEKRKPLFIGE